VSVHERLQRLAGFSDTAPERGVTREVFGPTYMRALQYLRGLMDAAGLQTRVDAMGNLIGRLEGAEPRLPRVGTGSHFDTTLDAGRYDGVVGVLGGIAAVEHLRERGVVLRRTLEVIGFAGEEPRFGLGCLGSRAMNGQIGLADVARLRDRDGVTLAMALRDAGLDPERVADARVPVGHWHAFVELHVEQGGTLEAGQRRLGIVERIAAAHDLRVVLRGEAVHSGATPMDRRRDALVGAAELVLEVQRLARESSSGTTVGTVGVLQVRPGAANVVPGEVELVIDVRDSNLPAREAVMHTLRLSLNAICQRIGLEKEVSTVQENFPVACAPVVVRAARATSLSLGVEPLAMTSGAYHDTVSFAGAGVPAGMIFIPSGGGVSHSPLEYTRPEDIDLGVAVLAGTLERLGGANDSAMRNS